MRNRAKFPHGYRNCSGAAKNNYPRTCGDSSIIDGDGPARRYRAGKVFTSPYAENGKPAGTADRNLFYTHNIGNAAIVLRSESFSVVSPGYNAWDYLLYAGQTALPDTLSAYLW